MAKIVSEIESARGRYHNQYLLDDGNKQTVISNVPRNYENKASSKANKFEPIELEFQDKTTDFLAEKNIVSIGFTTTKRWKKIFGIRRDASTQYETTPVSISLNGVERMEVAPTDITRQAVDVIRHQVTPDVFIEHHLRPTDLLGAVGTTLEVTDFNLKEQIHLKGIECINTLPGNEYTPDPVDNSFTFVYSDTQEFAIRIPQPIMWADGSSVGKGKSESADINHRLYLDGAKKDLVYEKTPTEQGIVWLSTVTGTLYIDTDSEFSRDGSRGYYKTSTTETYAGWVACVNAANSGSNYTTLRVGVSAFDDEGVEDHLWRSATSFVTSSIGSEFVTAASLELDPTNFIPMYGPGASTVTVSAQEGTGVIAGNAGYNDFTGTQFGTQTWTKTTDEGIKAITFNQTGKDAINTDGTTYIMLRENVYDYGLSGRPPGYSLFAIFSTTMTLKVSHSPSIAIYRRRIEGH